VDGVANHDVIKIDTSSNAVVAHFPMSGCERPHGIAVDSETHRVFATCANKVMLVIDGNTGQNIATLPIGAYSDGAVFDAKRKLAISPNGEGTLTVVKEIDPNTFAVLGTVTTTPGARTIAINPANGTLYLPAADVAKTDPPANPGGRSRFAFAPGSLKLLVFSPQN
jgi:DNA-binding beta-propeller fold protein YncE